MHRFLCRTFPGRKLCLIMNKYCCLINICDNRTYFTNISNKSKHITLSWYEKGVKQRRTVYFTVLKDPSLKSRVFTCLETCLAYLLLLVNNVQTTERSSTSCSPGCSTARSSQSVGGLYGLCYKHHWYNLIRKFHNIQKYSSMSIVLASYVNVQTFKYE